MIAIFINEPELDRCKLGTFFLKKKYSVPLFKKGLLGFILLQGASDEEKKEKIWGEERRGGQWLQNKNSRGCVCLLPSKLYIGLLSIITSAFFIQALSNWLEKFLSPRESIAGTPVGLFVQMCLCFPDHLYSSLGRLLSVANYHAGHVCYFWHFLSVILSIFFFHRQDKAALVIHAGIRSLGMISHCSNRPRPTISTVSHCCWLAAQHHCLWMEIHHVVKHDEPG